MLHHLTVHYHNTGVLLAVWYAVAPTSTLSVCDLTNSAGGTASCVNSAGIISVTSASYGRAADSRCIALFTRSTCAAIDVTSKARSLCDGKSSCNVTLSAVGLSSSSICGCLR